MSQQHTVTTTHTPHELAAALGLPPEAAERWIANGVEHDDLDTIESLRAENVRLRKALEAHTTHERHRAP